MCNTCHRELPLDHFSKRGDTYYGTCRECKAEKYRDTLYAKSVGKSGGGAACHPFQTPTSTARPSGKCGA